MNPCRPTLIRIVCFVLAVAGTGLYAQTQAAEPDIRRIEVSISDRQVAGESDVVRVTQGERVELVWSSDERVRLHLHGYDIETEASPGMPGVMSLTAHATGRFPITSHGFGDDGGDGHETLLYLEVYPD